MAQHDTSPDIRVENHGSIFLFWPVTETGRDWLSENVQDVSDLCPVYCEARFAWDIAQGAISDGLEVQ